MTALDRHDAAGSGSDDTGTASGWTGRIDPSTPPDIAPTAIAYPGARRPDRSRWVDVGGLHLATYEWGDPEAPVIFIAHGGFDFAGTYDVFAPLLADAGWRCVSWDARGHGSSEHADVYSWSADSRDALAVLDTTTHEPVVFLGHSKGGGIMLDLAHAAPHRLSHLINLDGLPSRNNWPDLADHERTRMLHGELTGWLDHRRSVAGKARKPGTLAELAERRQRMNPRLDLDWLEYLVTVGAWEGPDGWRWKIDPTLRMGGFGPWRPEWMMQRLPGIGVPVLGVLGLDVEVMGWGTRPEDVLPNLPAGGRFEALEGVGHFVHIEQPRRVADLVLEFLGDPPATGGGRTPGGAVLAGWAPPPPPRRPAPAEDITAWVRHGRSELPLHTLRQGEGRPLLLLQGLGEPAPLEVPPVAAPWPGPVVALDVTGHGDASLPRGGGYSAEHLMADVDAAVEHLGEVTVVGRGLGAYLALLISGGRPEQVRGAVLLDGPGLVGGGIRPSTPSIPRIDLSAAAHTPDPFVLLELSRDVRPPDYAVEFVRLANEWSGLDHPLAVCTVVRPEWLDAVVGQPGVLDTSVGDALATYAAL